MHDLSRYIARAVRRTLPGMLSLVVTVLGAGAAAGQSYPSKPIRVVTAEAGAATDIVARVIAQGLASA